MEKHMQELQEKYIEYDKELRVRRSIIGCILSITLVPAGVSLEWFIYPEFLKEFFAMRLFCALVTVFVLALHYTNLGKKHIKIVTLFWLTLIPATICMMIFVTDKYMSTYYAGLNLVILASAVVLAFRASEMTLFCAITLIFYLIAALKFPLTNFGILYNNVYFLVLTSIISVTSAYVNSRFRFKEFCLNHELKQTIATLKSTRDQLVHSEKINAIGSLSAGLLHEVNNPLNYTLTALQLMKMDPHVSSDPELKDTMKDIEEGMTRIKNIVTDLRAFAYPEEADKKNRFPILEAVESTLRFTAHECRGIKRTINIDPDLTVLASKTHIVQVLINLVSNAAKAIGKAGKEDVGGEITINAEEKNGRIIISVHDNGAGMNEETLKKVFNPFFTTNEVGKGMGLGLSISHTIVKNHGGNLSATSELGKGSTFYFDLPVNLN